MALRTIVKFGEDILRKKCRPVTAFDEKLAELLNDMAETMYEAQGVGLAAPQVGIIRRAVVIDVRDEHGLIELVNPEIISQSGSVTDNEGCLSDPDEFLPVERPEEVTVKAFDRNGKEFTVTGSGLLARAFCHEIDHLDGILFIDKAQRDEIPLQRS